MTEARTVELSGCTPVPLMNYLKSLAVLRLIAEQADNAATGAWRNGRFVLRSRFDFEGLVDFLMSQYRPTPIAAPWAGGSGFFGNDNRKAVESLASSQTPRLEPYRVALASIDAILKDEGITEKPANEDKQRLLRRYRRSMPDDFVDWMDAAVVLQTEGQAFPPILGTGGNDGRLDFTQNFMQRLVQLRLHQPTPSEHSLALLLGALRGDPTDQLESAAVGQFSPGRAGGPNGTQGMEAEALNNPWDFVLMLEGTLFMAGAIARRMNTAARDKAAFSFTVRAVAVGFGSGSDDESATARGEIWLPLWSRFASARELGLMFSEGRADLRNHQARDSVDFARAVASLGVDRGIDSFERTGFLKRSGKSFLATPLGRFNVRSRTGTDLLRELDRWLDPFRAACRDETTPARFKAALRRIEVAIFDYCRYGDPLFTTIVAALGNAERQLATGEKFRKSDRRTIYPISGLSSAWVHAANDHSREFRLAGALASIRGIEGIVGALRENLEPVHAGRSRVTWAEKERHVVWNNASLPRNLISVLGRRMLDAGKQGDAKAAFDAQSSVQLDDVAAFIVGETDDDRLDDLLWGLMLLNRGGAARPTEKPAESKPLISRGYALLKLLFLPRAIGIEKDSDGGCCARWANGRTTPGPIDVVVASEPEVMQLLQRGDVPSACRVAMRRLRASGLVPMPSVRTSMGNRDDNWQEMTGVEPHRLAAALLLPIDPTVVTELLKLVIRPPKDSLTTP